MPQRDSITLDTAMFDQQRAEAAVRELLLAVGRTRPAGPQGDTGPGGPRLPGDFRGPLHRP